MVLRTWVVRRKVGKTGMLTIPKSVCQEFGFFPGERAMIKKEGDKLIIEKVYDTSKLRMYDQ